MYGYGNSMFLATHGILARSGPTGPINTVAPAITGTAVDEYTLSCSTGTWTGTGSITYAYQWTRNGSNIGSATNSTYTLVTADVGQSILCVVTATDITGSASANSNTVTPISNAQYFINQAGITDATQQSAINQLVVNLKGYNIWTKMKALYPFVGGTATTHKFNLKNPLDTDAAFRLFWHGGWTHSSTGAKPNGTNGFAESYFTPNTEMGTNQQIAYYIGDNIAGNMIDIGISGGSNDLGLHTRHPTLGYLLDFPSGYADRAIFSNSDSRGNYLVFNNSTLGRGVYKNGASVYSSSFINKNIADVPLRTLYLSKNVYGSFSSREFRLVAFATGFTSLTEVTNFQTAVQAFQTTLGRNV